MAFVPINGVGEVGIIRDIQNYLLPPNVWSDGQNVRIRNGSVVKGAGFKLFTNKTAYNIPTLDNLGATMLFRPLAAMYVPGTSTNYWLVYGWESAGERGAGSPSRSLFYVWDGSNWYNRTPVIAEASTKPTLVEGTGGGLGAGVYKYRIQFVNAYGSTRGHLTEETITTVGTPGNIKVSLSSVPVSADSSVTSRAVYRTEVGGAEFKFVGFILDNVTTTFEDTVADGSLTGVMRDFNWADRVLPVDLDLAQWTGGVLSGIPFISYQTANTFPLVWDPVSTADGTGRLVEPTAWDTGSPAYCRVVRPFGNFLVGLHWNIAGSEFPYKVRWSHPADPGTQPSSWDITDATKDAGEFDLGQTPDVLVDCLPLRGVNVIYKEQSAWTMRFVGGRFIFNVIEISALDGMFSQNCATEFRPGMHAVLTSDDFVVHNTVSGESVIDKQNRDWLFSNIDAAQWARTFVYHNRLNNEVWICFPEANETKCTHALVWNHQDRTWGHRDLPEVFSQATGFVQDSGTADAWSTEAAAVWDMANPPRKYWGSTSNAPSEFRHVLLRPGTEDVDELARLLVVDEGTTETTGVGGAANPYLSFVERIGVAVSGLNRDGSATLNFESYKTLRGVRLRFSAVPADTLAFYIGTQEFVDSEVVWSGALDVNSSTDFKVDYVCSGRLFSFRLEDNSTTSTWVLDGLDLDISVTSLW